MTRYSFYITSVQKNSKKNWLKNTLENILELNSPQERKSFNDNFCKRKHFHQNSNKILGPEERQTSYWSQCIKVKLNYTSKIYKNNTLPNQKRSEIWSARELTVCATSRWNPRQTPINGSETKKNEACGTRCQSVFCQMNTIHQIDDILARQSFADSHKPKEHRIPVQ